MQDSQAVLGNRPATGAIPASLSTKAGFRGSLEIEGLPQKYEPGKAYTLTVEIAHPGRSRWDSKSRHDLPAVAPRPPGSFL